MNKKPYFISEISSNHNVDLERCKKLIQASFDSGCDAVKFQLFKIEDLFSHEILEKSLEHRSRKEWELPFEFIPELSSYCHELGIDFGCTPFYLDAVNELLPFVDFYKIASYELLWLDLIRNCSNTGKPLILSTGMATLDEVKDGVLAAKSSGCQNLTLLHCVSGYPTPINDCNLSAIKTLSDSFNCKVGWSDHTVNPVVISQSVLKWGAEVIEFHIDLEGDGAEFGPGHCWLPQEIKKVIEGIKTIDIIEGNGTKSPASCELVDREWRADPSDGLRPLLKTRENF